MTTKSPTPRLREIMRRAVEDGVRLGWRRAHKHTNAPVEDVAGETITDAVMGAIEEVFDFEGERA